MTIIHAYGFSVDLATKRVYLTEGKVQGFNAGIPTGADMITRGADHGDIVEKLTKVVINADLNLLYVDIAGKPYPGTIKTWEGLPHDERGRLLVDSVGKIVKEFKGLGFTEFGGVAMLATDVPNAPKLNNAYGEKNSVVLDFDYDVGNGDNLEPKFYTGYAVGDKTFKAEVYDPDEDMLIDGLTEGQTYDCYVTATSAQGKEGPKSNVIKATCKSVIPAPVFKTCVAGNGYATVTYDPITPPEPWTVDHYSYSAINVDDKDAPAVEGHVEGGKIALPNDVTWSVRLCAVCNPGRVPGDFSDALTVTPEKKVAPFKPTITQAYAKSGGQIYVEWVKGTTANGSRTSGTTVDQWKINFKSVDGKGVDFELTCEGNLTSITSDKVSIGLWGVTVTGHNEQGWGTPSNPVQVEYKPSVEDPLIGGTSWSSSNSKYKYCVFYSNATTGYEALRTESGKDITFEVLLIGAGGAGKGQTLSFGKGGDGGGGQVVYGELPPSAPGSIFVSVPNGGTPKTDSPANTTVKEGNKVLTAVAGKSANDKNNAEGFDRTKITNGWEELNMFTWLLPGSAYASGVASSDEQNYPSATFTGEGGAGTKDSNAGKGGESYVAIRWKK